MAHSRKRVELVGLVEIAELLHVELATAYRWRSRRVLPEAEWYVSKTPLWRRDTIVSWAKNTDRWREPALAS